MSSAEETISIGLRDGHIYVNGVQLYYVAKGTGPHAILCIPGAMAPAHYSFQPQLDYFGREESNFTVVAFDPRGYGYSRHANRFDGNTNYYITDAEDAHAIMEGLNFSSYSVLGWCDGATAALFLAALHPESVTNLIAWGARSYLNDEDATKLEVLRDTENWSPNHKEPWLKVYGTESKIQELIGKFLDAFNALRCETGGDICTKELSKIICPTLIIHGADDDMVSLKQPQYLHDHISGSKFIHLEDGKHVPHLSHHQRFNDIVEEFLLSN